MANGLRAMLAGTGSRDDVRVEEYTGLNVRQEIEVFVIFVLPAVAFAHGGRRFNKADLAYPFHHFESELVLNAKTQRSSMDLRKRRVVHLVRE